MKKKRADVIIDARLVSYRRGGISRYVEELCRWLPRVAPDLEMGAFATRSTPDLPSGTIRVHTPPHFRFERVTLGVELTARLPRVVHSPDFIAPSTVGVKRVITVHDLWFMAHPEHLSRNALRYYRQIERSIAVADRIIAVSHYTAAQLTENTRVDPKKIVAIWNGTGSRDDVPTMEQASITMRRLLTGDAAESILAGRPIILSVGTVEPRKRQDVLVRAMEQFNQQHAAIEPLLVIAGQPGWLESDMEKAIRQASLTGAALWLKSVDDVLLGALYRLATVLAMPSHDEGFGLPVLEAMNAGLPVIAAKRGALPEVAGDAACLVDDADPEAWAAALAAVISDRDRRRQMSEQGIVRAQQFSWERTALQTADVYREVMNR